MTRDSDSVHAISINQVDIWNNQDEREFEEEQMSRLSTGNCIAYCCFDIGFRKRENAMCNPPDARKLSDEEAQPYMDELQGGWKICLKNITVITAYITSSLTFIAAT